MLILSFLIKRHFASTALQKSAISVLLISNKLVIKNQASPRRYFLKIHIILYYPLHFFLAIVLYWPFCYFEISVRQTRSRLLESPDQKKQPNQKNTHKKTPKQPKTCCCFSLPSQISRVFQRILKMSINGPKSSSALFL